MTACFQDNIEGTELVVQIIMDNMDLRVTDVKTQHTMKNIHGRSARLDVYATDHLGKKYNIEIQRADKGAGAKRARFNSALIECREIPAELAKRVRYFKDDEKGVSMCKVMEELIREEKLEIVENLLGLGSVPAEKIAEATGFP